MAEKPRGRGRGRGARRAADADATIGGESEELSSVTQSALASMTTEIANIERSTPSAAASIRGDVESADIASYKWQVMRRPENGGFAVVNAQTSRIPLIANYLKFEIGRDNKVLTIARYEVKIEHQRMRAGKPLDRDTNRKIFWKAVEANPATFGKPYGLTYDDVGCLWAREKLALDGGIARINVYLGASTAPRENQTPFTVSLKFTGLFPISLQDALNTVDYTSVAVQFLDSVTSQALRYPHGEHGDNWYPFGRAVYRVPNNPQDSVSLGSGREMWTGFHMAAKIGIGWRPLINVDVARTAFMKREQPLITFMLEVLNERIGPNFHAHELGPMTALPDRPRDELSKALKGLKLRYKPLNGSTPMDKKFVRVDQDAKTVRFKPQETGDDTTVEDYFLSKYSYKLKYPCLPLISIGSRVREIKLPIELLYLSIEPQKVSKKLTDKQTSTMIKSASVPAPERFHHIRKMIAGIKYGTDQFANAFDIRIDGRLLEIEGQILPVPKLQMNRLVTPQNGQWELRNTKLCTPVKNIRYSLISLQFYQNENHKKEMQRELEGAMNNLVAACKNFDMTFANEGPIDFTFLPPRFAMDAIDERIRVFAKGRSAADTPNIIFIVMNSINRAHYASVKTAGDVRHGVMTQVILEPTLKKIRMGNPQSNATAMNVALKINSKLGGINNGIDKQDQIWRNVIYPTPDGYGPTIFLGIDVTHPGIGERDGISIASIVANIDFEATRYIAVVKPQLKSMERVVHIVDAVRTLLTSFYKNTQVKPMHIVVYRDGISEGEFLKVLNEEVQNIFDACQQLSETYRPTISYIVVQKRHHTRFVSESSNFQVGRSQNIPAGTCVDTVVTSPYLFDFFLCSHSGIQGTSRPAHYIVLYDEWKLNAGIWQNLTYRLCHLYVRCPRAVSIPTPVYYAHLACFRSRYHYQHGCGDHFSGSSGGGDADAPVANVSTAESVRSGESVITRMVKVNDQLQETMYFV